MDEIQRNAYRFNPDTGISDFEYTVENHKVCFSVLLAITGMPRSSMYKSRIAVAKDLETARRWRNLSLQQEGDPSSEMMAAPSPKRMEQHGVHCGAVVSSGGEKSSAARAWLQNYAADVADKMPTGGLIGARSLLRLPFKTRVDVFTEYKSEVESGPDSQNLVAYSTFNKVWRREFGRGRATQIELIPKSGGDLGKCDTCEGLKRQIRYETDPVKTRALEFQYETHRRQQREERDAYYMRRDLGIIAARQWWNGRYSLFGLESKCCGEEEGQNKISILYYF